MAKRCVGFVVVGEVITMVDARIPDDPGDPLTVIGDDTWKLQNGERASAYAVLHQRCADYLRENEINFAVIKGSALPTGSARLGLLTSAEVRGVIIAAAASVCEVKILQKGLISRTYGGRKVDEHLRDDVFWSEYAQGGRLRKTSREAAMLLVAARNRDA
jgi:hypothetical protein